MSVRNLAKLATAALMLTAGQAWGNVGASALADAQHFKGGTHSVRVDCKVQLFEKSELTETRRYVVYAGADKRTLVLFKSPAQAGEKMLMNDGNFWMFMPHSRRPIRITPMQKLLGQASLGDIATLSWIKDYTISSEDIKGQVMHLRLKAKKDSASYQKIDLRLDAKTHFPLSADLYLRSGMLAKTATYKRGQRDGKPAVVAMQLTSRLHHDRKTIVNYLSVHPANIPPRLFNPQILVRSDLSHLLSE